MSVTTLKPRGHIVSILPQDKKRFGTALVQSFIAIPRGRVTISSCIGLDARGSLQWWYPPHHEK
jgi:hypothetical protein